ncbi:MAG: uracil-DNA glycosylase [Telluria sp.]
MSAIPGRAAIFLEEMGIGPLWSLRGGAAAPESQAQAEAVPEPAPAPVSARTPLPAPSPALPPPPVYQPGHEPRSPLIRTQADGSAWVEDEKPAAITDEEIAAMDWAQLRAAIDSCTRCGLCAGGRKPVHGSGARQAQWLVAAGASTPLDEKEGQPMAGEAGKLLVNMLAAVGLARESDVYVTNLVKCRPVTAAGADRAPTAAEADACRPFLQREAALSGARVVLTMGQIAANGLLGQPLAEPLAAARGRVHALGDAALVATLHPGELLRRGADKALAWSDLCLAKAHDGRKG